MSTANTNTNTKTTSQPSSSSSASHLILTPTLLYHQLVWKNDLAGLNQLIEQQKQLREANQPNTNNSKNPNNNNTTSSLSSSGVLYDINSQDIYGNTALLLAVQLNRNEFVSTLLNAGAATKYRNAAGWTAVQESISVNNRDLIKLVVFTWAERSEQEFHNRIPEIMQKINAIGDFYLSIHWKFSSWLPLLGRVLPNDHWKIWKKGTNVRIDTSLVDFSRSSLSWKRGSLSFLFQFSTEEEIIKRRGSKKEEKQMKGIVKIYVMDHQYKLYARLSKDEEKETPRNHNQVSSSTKPPPASSSSSSTTTTTTAAPAGTAPSSISSVIPPELDEELEDRIDDLMETPLVSFTSPGKVEFTRTKGGMWGFRHDKNEVVNGYNCRCYDVKNINLLTTKRLEHLTTEERAKYNSAVKLLREGREIEHKLEAEMKDAHHQQQQHHSNDGSNSNNSTGGQTGDGLLELIDEPHKEHRAGLESPPPPQMSYEEYFGSQNKAFSPVMIWDSVERQRKLQADNNDNHPNGIPSISTSSSSSLPAFLPPPQLGRRHILKEEQKSFSAHCWMTDDFPLRTEMIVAILDMIAPHQRHVEKLRNFIEFSLPPGFPAKIQLPLFPTITATISFTDYSADPVDASMVQVPPDYREDNNKFALLLQLGRDRAGEE